MEADAAALQILYARHINYQNEKFEELAKSLGACSTPVSIAGSPDYRTEGMKRYLVP